MDMLCVKGGSGQDGGEMNSSGDPSDPSGREELRLQLQLTLDSAEGERRAEQGGVWPIYHTSPETNELAQLIGDPVSFAEDKRIAYRIMLKEAMWPVGGVTLFLILMSHTYLFKLMGATVAKDVYDYDKTESARVSASMGALLSLQLVGVALRFISAGGHPVLLRVVAEAMNGHVGAITTMMLVQCVAYIAMELNFGWNFIEARTGRLVYSARYIQWSITGPCIVVFSFRLLFNRPVSHPRCWRACVSISACMLFGFWSAIASSWAVFWILGTIAWLAFGAATIDVMMELQNTGESLYMIKFGSEGVKRFILASKITLWWFYGIFWMVCFIGNDAVSEKVEHRVYAIMDVIFKLSQLVFSYTWDETREAMQNTLVSYCTVKKAFQDQAADAATRKAAAEALQARLASSVQQRHRSAPARRAQAPDATATRGDTLPTFTSDGGGDERREMRRIDLIFQMIPRTDEQRESNRPVNPVRVTAKETPRKTTEGASTPHSVSEQDRP